MSQKQYTPYNNQFAPLWGVTKAGAMMDAFDQAAKAQQRAARYRQKATSAEPAPSSDLRPQRLLFGLTPKRLAAALVVIVASGLTAASWIV